MADAGLDDQKLFRYADRVSLESIIRATSDRWVEVYNPRLDRWEQEKLKDLVASAPRAHRFQTAFTQAGRTTIVNGCTSGCPGAPNPCGCSSRRAISPLSL